MEIEEAIKLLKANGYSVVKKPEPVKLLSCKCGRKRIDSWIAPNGYFYKCPVCGLRGMVGKNNKEAKILWNKAVETMMEENNA